MHLKKEQQLGKRPAFAACSSAEETSRKKEHFEAMEAIPVRAAEAAHLDIDES